MIDAIACEPQFLDHLAPIWRALSARGTFWVDRELETRALGYGIAGEPIDANRLRTSSPPPGSNPGDGPTALVASIGDIKVGRRLGFRRFVFIEHGAGQAYLGDRHAMRHPSYAGGADREDVTLFLCPNPYSADLWADAYPRAAVEIVGCPKLDTLPGKDPEERQTVAISFHWPGFVSPESDTAFGYYFLHLKELAQQFYVIGHGHPRAWDRLNLERAYHRAGIESVRDFADVCRRADVYVCDNSSTIFEFAATGRPVVVLNQPHYRKNVHHGLRFWEAADVGRQVDTPEELAPAIAAALADPQSDAAQREAALELVYPASVRRGAALRAARAIERHVAAQPVAEAV